MTPHVKRPPGAAARGGRQSGIPGTGATSKRSRDPREHQGIASARRPWQAAPTWPKPPGSDAARDLEAAFATVATQTFRVVAKKATGKTTTLLTTRDRREAEHWIAMHRQFAADCGAELKIEAAP